MLVLSKRVKRLFESRLAHCPSNPVTPPLSTLRALACWCCHRVRAMSMAAPSFEATMKV